MKSRSFVDVANLRVTAGSGGNGSASFRREIFIPEGGPDGGDGGRGGSIILRADPNASSLIHIFYQPERRAPHGGHGKGKQQYGRAGADMIIPVPCGTVVRYRDSNELVGDIVNPGDELVVARGGKGGLGNVHWKSSTNRAPREHTDGEPGEEAELVLELRSIANVGLVGFPNAGKSSLLAQLTNARPKVAAYRFTTLNPVIGTLEFPDYTRITIADIPGLIEGANTGVGLGHSFLRHIERATALLFVLDMAGTEGRSPADDFTCLRKELRLHSKELAKRRALVVANKMDVPEARPNLRAFKKKFRVKVLEVSAVTGDGMDKLKTALHHLAQPHP